MKQYEVLLYVNYSRVDSRIVHSVNDNVILNICAEHELKFGSKLGNETRFHNEDESVNLYVRECADSESEFNDWLAALGA